MSDVAVGLLRGPGRMLRWAALGGSSLGLASAAHLLGGGELPGAAVLAVAGVLIGLVALTVTARRVRLPVLLAVLGVQQLLLHSLFDLTSTMGPGGCLASLHAAEHAGAAGVAGAAGAFGAHPVLTCSPLPAAAVPSMGAASGASGWLMLAAHVVATVATAWLLARGEAWLWRLADRVAAAARVRLTVHTRRNRPGLVVAAPRSTGPRCWYDLAAPRGPPASPSVLTLS